MVPPSPARALLASICLLLGLAAVAAGASPSGRRRRGNDHAPQIKRTSFRWRASLDHATGVASSLERSAFDALPREESHSPPDTRVRAIARGIFAGYPRYLERPSLTLGLLRSVTSTETKHCHLRTSLLSLDVLTFGAPRVVSSRSRNHCDDIPDPGEVVCCVEIPIEGGLLAVADPKGGGDFGCLRFTWLRTKKNDPSGQPEIIALMTEIAGNYRPALAGERVPIPRWRSMAYCSTQRLLHAYVMWRYHAFVMREYRHKADEGK